MPKEATVVKIHGTTIDVRLSGSTKHLRGVSVVGGVSNLNLQDTVMLILVDRNYVAQSYRQQPRTQ